MILIVLASLVFLSGCPKPMVPAGDPIFITTAKQDMKSVATAATLYANDHAGILPTFDSNSLPDWWSRYSNAKTLDKSIHYTIPTAVAGKHLIDLKSTDIVVQAESDKFKDAGLTSNTYQLSMDGTLSNK